MPLTGRFRFRRSIMGKVLLQLEHDTGAPWPLSIAGRRRNSWRDARIVDLLQPQIHGLLELEHFVEEFPNANHGHLAVPLARRRVPAGEQPQAPAIAGPQQDLAKGDDSLPQHAALPRPGEASAPKGDDPAKTCGQD